MAWFIGKNRSPGQLFIHFNGAYHSDDFEGIYWYLNHYYPGLNIVTITTVSQKDISELTPEKPGKG